MGEGELPVVAAERDIVALREAMREANTRAAIVVHGQDHRVVTSRQVFDAWNAGAQAGGTPSRLTAADVGHAGTVPPPDQPEGDLARLLDMPADGSVLGQIEHSLKSSFDTSGAEVMVFHATRTRARVITRHERLMATYFGAYTECECAGPKVHLLEPHEVRPGNICKYPHGVPVTCR